MVASPLKPAYQELELLSRPHSEPPLRISHMTSLKRVREMWEIDQVQFDNCTLSFERFQEWWNRYEFGSRIALQDDRIVASFGLYPLSTEMAENFVTGQIRESDLLPAELEECERSPQNNWYASGVYLREDLRGFIQSKFSPLKPLLSVGLAMWRDTGHFAYPVNVFALQYSNEGGAILNRWGFEHYRSADELPDQCPMLRLSIRSDREFFQYMEARNLLS